MSAKATGKVWELDLTPAKQTVLLAYADHADHDGGSIRPGIPLIAWKTGYSERQVQRIVRELESDGLLVPVHALAGKPTEYRIDFSNGTQKPAYVPRKKQPTPDKMSPPDGDKMSPYESDEGVTSLSCDESPGGDIASANLTRVLLKEELKIKDHLPSEDTAMPTASKLKLGTPSFSGEVGRIGDPDPEETPKRKITEQPALCRKIASEIWGIQTPLAKGLVKALKSLSPRYESDPLYHKYVDESLAPKWNKFENGVKTPVTSRENAVKGILNAEGEAWAAYQAKHKPQGDDYEGITPEDMALIESPFLDPMKLYGDRRN